MTIEIHCLTLGIAATNCYLVADTATQEAVVIDPVDDAPLIYEAAQAQGWNISRILATHGHYDHVLAARELIELTGAPFSIHQHTPQIAESHRLPDFVRQLFPPIPTPDHLIGNGDETITVGSLSFETLFTPGHAPDHVCFFLREHNVLFGGDSLFAGSIGRTDLPYADHATLMQSIQQRILPFGDSVQVLPGHMQPTTIGDERRTNPFLSQME